MSKPRKGDPAWDHAALGLVPVLNLFSRPKSLQNLERPVIQILRDAAFEFTNKAAPYLVYRRQQSPKGAHAKRRRRR